MNDNYFNLRKKIEYSILTAVVIVLGLGYFAFGRFDSPASQIILFGPIVFLFTSHIRYMKQVEGRSFRRLLPYAAMLWAGTWMIEAAGVWSGLYEYQKTLLGSIRLGPVPILIPSVWLLFCWLAASIIHFLKSGSGAPQAVPSLLSESLATAWVLVSIALAIEWHFSGLIGLWNWVETPGGMKIDGVPAVNFLIWFAVGMISPVLQRIGRAPRIGYRTDSQFLRSLPVLGFGLVLAFNAGLNLVRGFPWAAALGALSVSILAAALVRKARRSTQAGHPCIVDGE
jgi:hypothetical protein